MIAKSLAQRPLLFILILAAILRLVAAIYSEGYLMHDDHFLVVESSASWADGNDYNNWLSWSQEKTGKFRTGQTPTPPNKSFLSLTSLFIFHWCRCYRHGQPQGANVNPEVDSRFFQLNCSCFSL